MSPLRPDPRDDDAAIQTDRYLETLLAASTRRGADPADELGVDPAVRDAARRLRLGLLPLHPSFRFEERLGRRLAAVARARLSGAREPARWAAIHPIGDAVPADRPADPEPPDAAEDAGRVARPVLIGGAITSAALSLAGAVVVAWWRGRPPRGVMARAIRAAHDHGPRSRAGGLATPVSGPGGPA